MIYIMSRTMFIELGGSNEKVIEYINETFNLRSVVIGIVIR